MRYFVAGINKLTGIILTMTVTKNISLTDQEQKSWTVINQETNDKFLTLLANELGDIIADDNGNKIQHLRPKLTGQGIKDTFSYKYGLDEFPYHTDTAFWAKPAKLILMTTELPSSCNTLLIDIKGFLNSLTESELVVFQNSVFTLKTPSQIKFVSVLQREKEDFIFRYDPNIMTPFNSNAKKCDDIIKEYIEDSKAIEIQWTGKNILVLNNWRMVHKRSECKNEPKRILKRIYIN
ncbi:MAG: TauD/TfdA family dioxygenase [Chitinophagales bacterium]|nr:TauD/TfdA family dioxygenase [Chitinophagales bacterium]